MQKFCTVDWPFSGFWNKLIEIFYLVCVKYWFSPNSQSNLFAGDVSGVENYSNLFYTHPATCLPLILLRQPISKSYSLCPSRLSLQNWGMFSRFRDTLQMDRGWRCRICPHAGILICSQHDSLQCGVCSAAAVADTELDPAALQSTSACR